ncbi:MAG TPA: pilin [Candidatus Paceibacterota bacterium]
MLKFLMMLSVFWLKLGSLFLGVRAALAQSEGDVPGEGTIPIELENPLEVGSFEEILDVVASFLFTISIPLLTVIILLGGFFILTAAGNPDRLRRGKQIILWGVVGFVIILVAGGVSTLVSNILGGEEDGGSSSCYDECIAELGNTPSECRAACGLSSP